MNVIDSSGWLEYFGGGPNAEFFASAMKSTEELVVPSISLYEVFKRTLVQRGRNRALEAAAIMKQGLIANLNETVALAAAKLSVESKLSMADCIMLATARAFGAVLWTQDADFEGIDGVRYVPARHD